MEASISSIIIDGYNLIGIDHTNLEAERRQLIELLIKYRKKKGHSVTVVFDGWKGGSRTESSSVRGGVNIIYSRLGEKAVISAPAASPSGCWNIGATWRNGTSAGSSSASWRPSKPSSG